MNNHSLQNTEEEPIAPGSSAAAPAAHTRYIITFHRRPEPLYTEKRKVSCPGFPPKGSPCNIHAAITMRFATSGSKPASLDAHGNTKRQRSCSHYTAICNQRARFERSRTRRTHEVPFTAGRSHFTRKNTRFPAPAFPQNEAHATSIQPLQCVLQLQVPNPHLSTHMATQNDNDHAAITLRSATRESRNAKNYAHMNNHSLQNTEEEPIAPGSSAAAPAAHTRYLSSPAGATLHGQT